LNARSQYGGFSLPFAPISIGVPAAVADPRVKVSSPDNIEGEKFGQGSRGRTSGEWPPCDQDTLTSDPKKQAVPA